MKKDFLLVFGLLLGTSGMFAQNTWYCDEYPDFQPQLVQRTQTELTYYMSSEQTSSMPPADSIWVVDTAYVRVMTITAQEGEPISISNLKWGIYLFKIKLGDCEWGKIFFRRKDSDIQGVENTSILKPSATKLLRDGQLLIQNDDKLYNAQGVRLQ